MKILITGVAGMLGSHLADILINKNYEVYGIDNLSVGKKNNIKIKNKKKFKFFKLDIRNKNKVFQIIKKVNTVVHLAAIKKVSENQSSFPTLDINVTGTKIVLDAAKKFKKKVIFASTSDVYGISKKLPFKENENLVLGQSLAKRWAYAVSKIYCEHLCYCYHKEFGVDIVILRYFGGFSHRSSFSWSGGHIPAFVNQILKKQPITVHGNGKQTRSMGHAIDLANGTYLAMKSKRAIGKIINIGNNQEISVLKTLKMVLKEMNININDVKIKFIPEKKIFGNYRDIRRRKPSLSLAKKILGYKPKISTAKAIKMLVNEINKK
jgi:UDP-glucose 4-epimerase